MITIYCTTYPDFYADLGIPIFPPLEYVWDVNKQRECWRDLFKYTHVICWSEALINFLGALVECGAVDKDDIQIYVEGYHKWGDVPATYDSEGILENWPFGYFLGTNYDDVLNKAMNEKSIDKDQNGMNI